MQTAFNDCTSEFHSVNRAAFSDTHRKVQKKLTEDEGKTEGDSAGLSEVEGHAPDPTNRGQISQKKFCSEGNYSVQTCF